MTPERLTHLPPTPSGCSGGTKCVIPSLSVVAAPFSLVLSVAVTPCLHCPPHPPIGMCILHVFLCLPFP